MKKKLVVITGAGISAESGIKTFRDHDGLWENHKIEDVAHIDAWHKNKALVLDFYNQRRANALAAEPNGAHLGLKELEQHFEVRIVTQNVDDLHERAGSKHILHLHGSLLECCSDINKGCVTPWTEAMNFNEYAPDGGHWRPNIVWFGEDVPLIEDAISIVEQADILVVIGTSLQVYPAANLLAYAPNHCPIYIIDPKLNMRPNNQTVVIQNTAVAGIKELTQLLLNNES